MPPSECGVRCAVLESNEDFQPIYFELRGKLEPPLTAGPGADYRAKLMIEEVLDAAADTTRCEASAG